MLQNNAELRGTGGYTSSFATGRTQDGRLLLDPLQDLIEVADPPDADRYLPAPEEYAEDYQMFGGNSTMWRTWNMSPHVPDSALVGVTDRRGRPGSGAGRRGAAGRPRHGGAGGARRDGDRAAGRLDASSPSELTQALLVDSYAAAGSDESTPRCDVGVQLQAAATAAVGRLLGGDVPAADLARTLVRLADQRHLAVWSGRSRGAGGARGPGRRRSAACRLEAATSRT